MLKDKRLFLLDMDGTIYLGNEVFDFAIRFINNLRKANKKVLFFTNNATRSDATYIEKLTRLGFSPSADEIMTSGDVTFEFLKRHRAGKSVYLVGTDELCEEYASNYMALRNTWDAKVLANFTTDDGIYRFGAATQVPPVVDQQHSGWVFRKDLLEKFGLEVPTALPGVNPAILDPRDTYADVTEWETKAKDLAGRFVKNFVKYTGNDAGKALVAAGPEA